MGNTASTIADRVNSLNSEALQKTWKVDHEVIDYTEELYNYGKYSSLIGLDDYEVPGSTKIKSSDEGKSSEQEVAMALSMINPRRFAEKHSDVKKTLQQDILANRSQDPTSGEIIKRLQTICLIHEALLREEKRNSSKGSSDENRQEKKDSLPESAKLAIRWGISTILNLVQCVGPINPQVYSLLLENTSEILSQFTPNALTTEDPTISEAIDKVTSFFGKILNGEIQGISADDQLKSLSPLLGLATATGSITSILSIANRFLIMPRSDQFNLILKVMLPLIQQIYTMEHKSSSYVPLVWSQTKKRSDMVVSNEGLSVTRTDSSGWGSILSEESITSGVHYYEIIIDQNGSDCLYIGVSDSTYTDFNSTCNSNFVSYAYKVEGSITDKNGNTKAFTRLQPKDRVGLLINMEDKNVIFFRNGEKQTHEPFGGLPEKVSLFATFGGSNQLISIVENPDIPAFASDQIGLVQRPQEGQEEEKELVEHSRFDVLRKDHISVADYNQITPSLVSTFILSCLDKLNKSIRSMLESDKKFNCKRKYGLALDVAPTTIESIYSILKAAIYHYNSQDWSILDQDLSRIALTTLIRLLRSHLIATKYFESATLSFDIRQDIYKTIDEFTDTCQDQLIGDELALILSTCFDIFFEKPKEKLEYLIERLEDMKNNKEQSGVRLQLQDKMFQKMAQADKLYPAFDLQDDSNFERVSKFLNLIVDISGTVSVEAIKQNKVNIGMIKMLEASQKCFLSQAAKTDFQGKCQDLLLDYVGRLLQTGSMVMAQFATQYNDLKVDQNIVEQIQGTILYSTLPNLLNSLMIIKLNLDLVTILLPHVQSFAALISNVQGPDARLVNGIGIVKEVYESAHNYPDNANLTHLVQVPNAKKYVLKFDPQCRTENGCDYLQLWRDMEKSNQIERWEGERFPKDPVVIEHPFLLFSFRSDGSVNYWGWRIDIEAHVELQYFQREWPDHLKDSCRMLLASMARKLISGDFEMTPEDDKVKALLENPLLKFGVKDKCHQLVKPLEPLPDGLVNLAGTPGLYRSKSSIAERIAQEEIKKKILISETAQAVTLPTYVANYGIDDEVSYSDIDFLNELIDGSERVINSWNQLKKKAGVTGGAASIGGNELDKAERAIFAVFTAFFEIIDTINKIISNPSGDLAPILKYIIQQSCAIRNWAQKHKQYLLDQGNEITYTDITNDIVKKCSFLLHSEYKLSLNDLGVKKVMFKLVQTVMRAQSHEHVIQKKSKWLAVQKAVKTMSLLRNLLGVKKKHFDTQNTSTSDEHKEFNRVNELVKQFLESDIAVEKVAEAMEKRRTRALARALGFQSLAQMLSVSNQMETAMIRSFADAMRNKQGKIHYWDGLEGTDPYLLTCVKTCFFKVFDLLQKDLIRSANRNFDWMYLHHYLTVIEAMSYPFRDIDSHVMLELNVSKSLKSLLRIAKGYFGVESDLVEFDETQAITGLVLKLGGEISQGATSQLVRTFGETELHVEIVKGGANPPIKEVLLVNELQDGYNVESGPIEIDGQPWYILIKRGEAKAGGRYLTSISSEFECEFKNYDQMQKPYSDDKLEKLNELKLKLRKSAWNLFKLITFGTAGSPEVISESKKILVQELIISVIDEELEWNRRYKTRDEVSINLKKVASAYDWMDSRVELFTARKNPMSEWLRQFHEQAEIYGDEVLIKDIIDNYVNQVDPAMQGIIGQDVVEQLDDDAKSLLSGYDEIKNDRGEYDFFKYLNVLVGIADSFTPESIEFIGNSYLFKAIPVDYNQAEEEYNVTNPSNVLQIAKKRFLGQNTPNSNKLFDLLEGGEKPGICEVPEGQEYAPGFLNSEGKLDLYKLLNQIKSEPDSHTELHNELQGFFHMYSELPPSVELVIKQGQLPFNFLGSMLWTVYESCGSWCLPKVLSRPERVAELFKHMLMTGSDKTQVLAFRILRNVIPEQHSPQTIANIWSTIDTSKISMSISQEARSDFLRTLFGLIGLREGWMAQRSPLKFIERWSLEANDFLRALIQNQRWQDEFEQIVIEELGKMQDNISAGQKITDVQLGIFGFMASLVPSNPTFLTSELEWTRVKLKDSTIAQGTIKSIEDGNLVIYSEEDDSTVTENIRKVECVLFYNKSDYLNRIDSNLAQLILDKLTNISQFISVDGIIKNISPEQKPAVMFQMKALEVNVMILIGNLVQKVDSCGDNIIDSILRPSIRTTKSIKEEYNGKRYAKCERLIFGKLKEIQEEKKQQTEEMTEEAAMEQLGQLSEEDQIRATELMSINISIVQIIKAFQAGIKDDEGVRDYVPSDQHSEQNVRLYNLRKTEEETTDVRDPSAASNVFQNKKGHLIIRTKQSEFSRVVAKRSLPLSIYREVKRFPREITILFAIAPQQSTNFGFTIGTAEFGFLDTGSSILLSVNGQQVGEVDKLPIYAVRLFCQAQGEVQFLGDNFKLATNFHNSSVFNGVSIGNYSLWLEEGTKVILQGFEIHHGHNTTVSQYWSEADKEDISGQFLRPHVQTPDPNRFRLLLTGAPEDMASAICAGYDNLQESTQALLQNVDSNQWSTNFTHKFEAPIVDIKLFSPDEGIGGDWEVVPFYLNNEIIQYQIPNRKIIAVKRHQGLGLPSQFISSITVAESRPEYELLDNLTISTDNDFSNNIYVKKSSKDKTTVCLRGLVFIVANDLHNVQVPIGFTLISNKEMESINVVNKGNKENMVFLAYSDSITLLGCPISPLSGLVMSGQSSGSQGMVNDFDDASKSKKKGYKFKEMSLVELVFKHVEIKEAQLQQASQSLILNIIRKDPSVLNNILLTESLTNILLILKNQLNLLEEPLLQALRENNQEVNLKILSEILFQLMLNSYQPGGTSSLQEHHVESKHPYDNNLDIDECICIPGAIRLRIEFDPQSHTESGCDPLRFYARANRQEEIKNISGGPGGSSWEPFEVEGDTVHTYFHTDGSVVYWGYKFKVIPIAGKKVGEDPLSQYSNPNALVWLLEKVSDFQNLGYGLDQLLQKHFIIPLFLFIHSKQSIETTQRALIVLKKLLRGQQFKEIDSMLNLLIEQAIELNEVQKIKQEHNPILQAIILVLAEHSQKYNISLTEDWFVEFCNAYYDMNALSKQDQSLFTFLFERYIKRSEVSPKQQVDIDHYPKQTQVQAFSFVGASGIKVQFEEDTKLPEGHTVLFTHDREGTQSIETSQFSQNLNDKWTNDPKGPDVVLSNENLRATRTDSSGWGNVL